MTCPGSNDVQPETTDSTVGPMERAVRKWDGDVYHGHEPEAWADLRLIARQQDAQKTDTEMQLAHLRRLHQSDQEYIGKLISQIAALVERIAELEAEVVKLSAARSL